MTSKLLAAALFSLSTMVGVPAAHAALIDFENINHFEGGTLKFYRLTKDYGYTWTGGRWNTNDWAVSPASSNWWGSSITGPLAHSGNNYAWNGGGDVLNISGSNVQLNSFWVRGANLWSDTTLTVLAFKGGEKVGDKTITLSETYQLVTLNFGPADFIAISNSIQGSNFLIDDLSVGAISAVPEPGTWAMLLAGLGVAGFAARRKRKAM